MGANSKIEWTTHTFNAWTGCEPIGPGCEHCYAEGWAKRTGRDFAERRRTGEKYWQQPIKWNRDAFTGGTRPRVFCNSLADLFDNQAPQEWRRDLFALIRQTRHLDWLLLTKRIGNAPKMLPPDWGDGFPNVWLMATVVSQEELDRDTPKLLNVPAAIHGLSIEPMLGPICVERFLPPKPHSACFPGRHAYDHTYDLVRGDKVLCRYCFRERGRNYIDWIICGGESGPGARPMHPDWARSLRDQCMAAGVPFLFKQWGEYAPADAVGEVWRHPGVPQRVGKKRAGRLLDGREWSEFPR